MTAPAPGPPRVTVRGGTDPSAVDTAQMTERVAALRRSASALDDVAERCASARLAVALVGPEDVAPRQAFGVPAGLEPVSPFLTGVWPAHVLRARDAVLDAVDDVAAHARTAAADVRDVAARMEQSVRVYDDAALSVDGVLRELRLGVRGAVWGLVPGVGLLVPPLFHPVADVAVQGVIGTLGGVLRGDGFAPGRVATSTQEQHGPLVSWLSRWIGLANPRFRLPWEAPTVGDAAAVLSRLDLEGRDRFLPDPAVTRVHAPGIDLPVPHDTRSALDLVDALYDDVSLPGSVIGVQRVDRAGDGPDTWVVAVPGTQLDQDRTVFSMTSNLRLMDVDVDRRVEADSARAVLAAMRAAGIPPGDDVLLVGHSQGGMVAATVAAATVGTYSVRHVVTAGSPVAGHALPEGVKGTHLETQGEVISDLDGVENPATRDRVTVTGEFRSASGGPAADLPHGVGFHQQVLDAATEVGDRGLDEHLTHVEGLLDGTPDDPLLFEARLVPRADPDAVCRVPAVAPFAPAGPFVPTGPQWEPPPGQHHWSSREQHWTPVRPPRGP
ncbi:PGAP1-like alpha/beta domain-containing protein [Cellulosimicrobium marinum]|uniref:PGAP1-like alpha/beta domain-containing protein n=1 Tax=Cellulosimicrobium marinum TaxID=1638992 RepID=UPI001E636553|nr:hypothetical protein [Cellulosimicrobium marinum]MCB7135680.1 hypothetical protein [Cellulosimicrobium marinum]